MTDPGSLHRQTARDEARDKYLEMLAGQVAIGNAGVAEALLAAYESGAQHPIPAPSPAGTGELDAAKSEAAFSAWLASTDQYSMAFDAKRGALREAWNAAIAYVMREAIRNFGGSK